MSTWKLALHFCWGVFPNFLLTYFFILPVFKILKFIKIDKFWYFQKITKQRHIFLLRRNLNCWRSIAEQNLWVVVINSTACCWSEGICEHGDCINTAGSYLCTCHQVSLQYVYSRLYILRKVIVDFAACDWWCYLKALRDVKFSQIEENGRKFRSIELSNSVISYMF